MATAGLCADGYNPRQHDDPWKYSGVESETPYLGYMPGGHSASDFAVPSHN